MRKKRKNFGADFKAKVAIEALKDVKTLADMAIEFDIHPNQISQWKKEFLENASSLFVKANKPKVESKERSTLLETIGQLQVENNWLKKKLF